MTAWCLAHPYLTAALAALACLAAVDVSANIALAISARSRAKMVAEARKAGQLKPPEGSS